MLPPNQAPRESESGEAHLINTARRRSVHGEFGHDVIRHGPIFIHSFSQNGLGRRI